MSNMGHNMTHHELVDLSVQDLFACGDNSATWTGIWRRVSNYLINAPYHDHGPNLAALMDEIRVLYARVRAGREEIAADAELRALRKTILLAQQEEGLV